MLYNGSVPCIVFYVRYFYNQISAQMFVSTWMEYIMILKQRTANVLLSQSEWLSRCLEIYKWIND